MNKKLVRIVNLCLVLLLLIIMFSNSIVLAKDFKPSDITGGNAAASDSIKNVGGDVIAILRTVGVVLSVVILIVIGIKYMMGSAEEKAEYKKTMMPYIIGAALIFAASALSTIVYEFMSGISA